MMKKHSCALLKNLVNSTGYKLEIYLRSAELLFAKSILKNIEIKFPPKFLKSIA